MKHAILARNTDHFRMIEKHLRGCHTELRQGGATEIKLVTQLRGVYNVIIHIVEGWEYGFRQQAWRDITRAITLLESTGKATIMHYTEKGEHKRPPNNARDRLDQYRSHKVVRAGKIQTVERVEELGQFYLRITTEKGVVIEENSRGWLDRLPSQMLGGYYVLYEDGYTSWSPAKAFEEGNTLLPTVLDAVLYDPAGKVPPIPIKVPASQAQKGARPVEGAIVYVRVGVNIQPGRTITGLCPSATGALPVTLDIEKVELVDTTLFIQVANSGVTYRVCRLGADEYEMMESPPCQ